MQRRTIPGWTFNGAGTTTNPYYRSFTLQDSPAFVRRQTYAIKADWKFAPRHVLSATAQINWYKLSFAAHLLNVNAGVAPLSYGPEFTQGALGVGTNNAKSTRSPRTSASPTRRRTARVNSTRRRTRPS